MGTFTVSCEGEVPLLFTENETNHARLFGTPNESPYVKDGINECVVNGRQDAVNPEKRGTKVAAHYHVTIGAGQTSVIRLRLATGVRTRRANPLASPSNSALPTGFVKPMSSTRRSRRRP